MIINSVGVFYTEHVDSEHKNDYNKKITMIWRLRKSGHIDFLFQFYIHINVFKKLSGHSDFTLYTMTMFVLSWRNTWRNTWRTRLRYFWWTKKQISIFYSEIFILPILSCIDNIYILSQSISLNFYTIAYVCTKFRNSKKIIFFSFHIF